ncbi:MAG: flagellar biosynthesis anti-sigma factor FlgM [Steroidobacteraceae bacterium]|jgi:negative regulator of flagellin synthesis FlgM|nr:flagellar biosynthesis anti-sigma factor FlgM [Steroidobacteraceae bacterium]
MSNKIDGFGQRPVQVDGGSRTDRAGRGDGDDRAVAPASAADRVTLTDSARQLQRLAEAVAAAPDFDPARVAALKDAVNRGEYRPDAQRVADRMIALERELAGQ